MKSEEDLGSRARKGQAWKEGQVGESPGLGCASRPAFSCNLAVPARAGRRVRRGYLAAKSPAANEPRVVQAIFSSRSSGPLIAAEGSCQAAMEMLNATARAQPLVPARASCPPVRGQDAGDAP